MTLPVIAAAAAAAAAAAVVAVVAVEAVKSQHPTILHLEKEANSNDTKRIREVHGIKILFYITR